MGIHGGFGSTSGGGHRGHPLRILVPQSSKATKQSYKACSALHVSPRLGCRMLLSPELDCCLQTVLLNEQLLVLLDAVCGCTITKFRQHASPYVPWVWNDWHFWMWCLQGFQCGISCITAYLTLKHRQRMAMPISIYSKDVGQKWNTGFCLTEENSSVKH